MFSSGGVDSLALLSGISQLGSKRPTALTIAYDTAAGAGELEAGAAAAHAAGLAHEALLVNPEDLKPESASQIFRRFDEPCMVFNRGPTQFFLTAAAQRLGLKVAVSGAMGENVVGDMAWLAKVKDMPDATQGLSDEEFFATMLARRRQLFAEDDAQVLSRVDTPVAQLLLQLTQDFTQGVQTRSRYENYMAMSVFLASTGELTACGRVISRLNGIEERLPFADRRLFEFMQSVPPRLKGSETLIKQRDLLRAAFANDEPMASRPPVSGALPGFPWQASPWLAPLVLKQAKRIANDDHLLAPALARKVLEKYQRRRGRRDAKLVWMLFALQTWFDLNIAEDDPFRQAA